ncbi:MAG: PLP-dependent transferase [Cephaloticoccus sp.]|nr:PLP-dependent transferase [Cephaloticoccus sp.]MCF7761998.1 PLP-dependent transferase [Cephaloticoccus sp.]
MPAFAPIPLGQPIPPTPHAVSCSLPTMAAVHGYEQRDPAIVRHMTSGYPRFVVHPFVQQLSEHYRATAGLAGQFLWLTSSARIARELIDLLAQPATNPNEVATATAFAADGIHGVAHPDSPEVRARAKRFLQNSGGFLSSRAAEDRLVQLGLVAAVHPETYYPDNALTEVRHHLQPLFAGTVVEDILPATCGMNALYAAFRTLAERQSAQGRTVWVQLGWLYLDTIALLKRFALAPDDYVHLPDVFDLPALEQLFSAQGNRIAGLIIEAPTNPLIQTPDLAAIAGLTRSHGAVTLIDCSVSSPFSVDVLPHADVVTVSLTKYAASEGDLMAGLVVVNPNTPQAAKVRQAIAARLEPVYPRDLARLAHEIGRTPEVLRFIETSVPLIAAWLEAHPAVKRVAWAHHQASRDNYEKIARSPESVGCMISFSLHQPIAEFYDRLQLPKGPSFGMKTTLICPFIYLAHYELATTETGRAELAASGLDPDLLRLSVGCEPVSDIIDALDAALAR